MIRYKQVKRTVVVTIARTLILIVNLLPRRAALFVGAWCGWASWKIIRKDQHLVHRHLTLAFGDRLSWNAQEAIGRRLYIDVGKNAIDLMRFPRHFRRDLLAQTTVHGREHLDRALARGRGVVLFSGHIGHFELLGAWLATLERPFAEIVREMYEPRLDQYLMSIREAVGIQVFRTTDHPRKALAWLRAGNMLGVAMDTDSPRVRSIPAPFLGRWANTPVGHTILGLRAGAAFVPAACLRNPDDTFRVILGPEVNTDVQGDFQERIRRVTLLCNKVLEEMIRACPEQWIWMHNRWKTPKSD